MNKLLLLLPLLLTGCPKTTDPIVIHKLYMPEISCPETIVPVWKKYDINATEKENLLVEGENAAMAARYAASLRNRIRCFEQYYELIKSLIEKEK